MPRKRLPQTSAQHPEKKIHFSNWGGDKLARFRPFQIVTLRTVLGRSKPQSRYHLGGRSIRTIEEFNKPYDSLTTDSAKVTAAVYFFPNDIETSLHIHTNKRGTSYPQRTAKTIRVGTDDGWGRDESQRVWDLANINFCYIDFDISKELTDIELRDKKSQITAGLDPI